jgi:hypothetical protein
LPISISSSLSSQLQNQKEVEFSTFDSLLRLKIRSFYYVNIRNKIQNFTLLNSYRDQKNNRKRGRFRGPPRLTICFEFHSRIKIEKKESFYLPPAQLFHVSSGLYLINAEFITKKNLRMLMEKESPISCALHKLSSFYQTFFMTIPLMTRDDKHVQYLVL